MEELFSLLCGVEIKGNLRLSSEISKWENQVGQSISKSRTQDEFRTGDTNLRVISVHSGCKSWDRMLFWEKGM